VGPLTVALVILLLLIVYIYAVERVVFRQPSARAAGITTLTILFSSELGFVVGALVLVAAIPLGCLYVVHLVVFGQQRAKTMRPAVWLRGIFWRPSRTSSTASPIRLP
jgi:hypothetical protein